MFCSQKRDTPRLLTLTLFIVFFAVEILSPMIRVNTNIKGLKIMNQMIKPMK